MKRTSESGFPTPKTILMRVEPSRQREKSEQRSARYEKAFEHSKQADGSIAARLALGALNSDLIAVERSLTLSDGLPGRSWFQHQIYAPGFYTGYGVKTLPGVRESIEQKQWKLAQEQIGRVGGVLENAGERIQSATAELDRGSQ